MKFLRKNSDSKILSENLKYSNVSDRPDIRKILLAEQKGFCAYSEEYFTNADTKVIEHFYPKAENPDQEDNYFNWYLVKEHVNTNRPKKIRDYLPILNPQGNELKYRVKYIKGAFRFEENESDKEALNFVRFLNLNRPELVKDRANHLKSVQRIKKFASSEDEFFSVLKEDNSYLSYISILEIELGLELVLEKFI